MTLKQGKYLLFAVFLGVLFFSLHAQGQDADTYEVRLYLFHSESCPHCRDEIKFLEKEVEDKYPNLTIDKREVSKDFKNLNIFKKVIEAYGLDGSVPVNVIGDDVIVGFKKDEILKIIEQCSETACDSKIDGLMGYDDVEKYQGGPAAVETGPDDNSNPDDHNDHKLDVNIFGKQFCLESSSSVCLVGVALGLADGINPCMFSVLLFMLTYLLAIGSRKRALKSGIAFILTTFVVYFLFMYGIIKVVDVLQIAHVLRAVVVAIAFFVGAVMIKDYFFYGKGISLEIPQKYKPKLEQLIKKGTVFSAIILALFSSLVELPCTSGLPLAYTSILSSRHLYPFWYLFVYNLFFILPLLIILVFVLMSWRKVERLESWRNATKKYMRLVSGILLILLGLALLFNWI